MMSIEYASYHRNMWYYFNEGLIIGGVRSLPGHSVTRTGLTIEQGHFHLPLSTVDNGSTMARYPHAKGDFCGVKISSNFVVPRYPM